MAQFVPANTERELDCPITAQACPETGLSGISGSSNSRAQIRLLASRRAFLGALTALATSSIYQSIPSAIGQTPAERKPGLLQSPRDVDQLTTRTRIQLQLSGKLSVADPDPSSKKPAREAEIKAESTIDFDERTALDPEGNAIASAREYHEAGVKTWVAGHASSHELRPECYQTRLARFDGVWQQYGLNVPFQPREVDMVRLPINSVVIDQLLPLTPVKADSVWTPSERTVAELFQLEAVHKSSLQARVTKVEKGVATIACDGDVEGTINSVPTKLTISSNLHAQLGKRCAMVTWMGASISETRDISQAEPGFTITARLQLIRKEEDNACSDVALSELKEIATLPDDGRWLVQVTSVPGRYHFMADRKWKTIVDTGEESILRYVEKNQVVAQCNITRLPKLAAGQQLTLAGMQDDIKRSLEKNMEQMLEASERKNGAGLRVLRTVVLGKSSDVPVRWVYTHISDDSGRRVSLVFTMSGEAAEQFGLADDQMTSSFVMLPEPTEKEPTPAEPEKAASAPTKTTTR